MNIKLFLHCLGLGVVYGILIALVTITAVVESRIAVELPKECEMDIQMQSHVLTLVKPCRIVTKI